MPKIRLLIDAHVFDGEFQGSRTFIEHIYLNLIRKFSDGFDFFFAAEDIKLLESIFGVSDSVNYIKLTSTNRYNRLLIEYPGLIKKYRIDYAHFQYIAPPFKACKYILTTHDVLFERFPKYFPLSYRLSKHVLFKYAAKHADILTTVSDYSKEEISHFYNIDANTIHVIPNGVSVSEQSGNSIFETNYVLYLSRIEPRKNHHLLLNCFKRLKLFEKGYQLVFVGKESIASRELKKSLSELNEEERKAVKFLEGISETEKTALIKNCSLFVYPSSAEGFGIPPLEAGILRVPVVCSNTTSMKEFDFFGTGHIDPNDENALCETIKIFIENPDKENRALIAKRIMERYDWKNNANKFAQLILNDSKA